MKFKENLIFELEKDKPIKNTKLFNEHLYKTYGYVASNSDIRTKIINYQLNKYGDSIGYEIRKTTKYELMKEKNRRSTMKKRRRNG